MQKQEILENRKLKRVPLQNWKEPKKLKLPNQVCSGLSNKVPDPLPPLPLGINSCRETGHTVKKKGLHVLEDVKYCTTGVFYNRKRAQEKGTADYWSLRRCATLADLSI